MLLFSSSRTSIRSQKQCAQVACVETKKLSRLTVAYIGPFLCVKFPVKMKFSLSLTLSNIFEPSNEQSESYLKTNSVLYYESDFPVRKMGTLTRYALYVWPGLPGWEWQSGDLVTGEVSQTDDYMIHQTFYATDLQRVIHMSPND